MTFKDLLDLGVSHICNDEDSVMRFNVEFMGTRVEYDCYIFMKNGQVYATRWQDPMTTDKVYRVR